MLSDAGSTTLGEEAMVADGRQGLAGAEAQADNSVDDRVYASVPWEWYLIYDRPD